MKPCILFSTSYNPIIPSTNDVYKHIPLKYYVRPIDYKIRKGTKLRFLIKAIIDTHRYATDNACSHVILCNAGFEVPLSAFVSRLCRPAYQSVALDYIMPPSYRYDKSIAKLVTSFSNFIVIRNGDKLPLNQRFGIPLTSMSFAKLPILGDLPTEQGAIGSYIYSGGTARRDWLTFCNSVEGLSMKAKVVTNTKLSDVCSEVPTNIDELGHLSPASARKIMEASKLVCLSFEDTLLPSGPLVLLDAMSAGKAIVATKCNGTRDYITHLHNGMFVPPRDHVALRDELIRLYDDESFRQQLGVNARQTIIDEHMPEHFFSRLLSILNLV